MAAEEMPDTIASANMLIVPATQTGRHRAPARICQQPHNGRCECTKHFTVQRPPRPLKFPSAHVVNRTITIDAGHSTRAGWLGAPLCVCQAGNVGAPTHLYRGISALQTRSHTLQVRTRHGWCSPWSTPHIEVEGGRKRDWRASVTACMAML
jgi:hypothetical protein